jgi:hypothetical protein
LRHAETLNPTWINNRAVDILFSYSAKDQFRRQLERALEKNLIGLVFPTKNLWRSDSWIRVDGYWKTLPHLTIFRFNKNYTWTPQASAALLHLGAPTPSDLGFGFYNQSHINFDLPTETLVGLHQCFVSHELIERKFEQQMIFARSGRARGVPSPETMPPVAQWPRFNGYKAFVEWAIELTPTRKEWHREDFKHSAKPKLKSLYSVIKKYNVERAEEYQKLFENHFGAN